MWYGIMNSETLQLELELLRGQQAKAREEEVFGGLTSAERAAYGGRDGSRRVNSRGSRSVGLPAEGCRRHR